MADSIVYSVWAEGPGGTLYSCDVSNRRLAWAKFCEYRDCACVKFAAVNRVIDGVKDRIFTYPSYDMDDQTLSDWVLLVPGYQRGGYQIKEPGRCDALYAAAYGYRWNFVG